MDLENEVFNELSSIPGKIEPYSKRFFEVLVKYSFDKTNLELKEHFFPSLHVVDVLDGFAQNKRRLGDILVSEVIGPAGFTDNNSKLLSFCDSVLFYAGLFPSYFKKGAVKVDFYKNVARKGFGVLYERKQDAIFLKMMNYNLEQYVGALSFMKNNLLPDSFRLEDDKLILQ